MNGQQGRLHQWVYQGVWGVITRLFLVPEEPPHLPTRPGETAMSFRPAPRWLDYLKFQFWIGLIVFAGVIFVVWVVIMAAEPIAGVLIAPVALALFGVPYVVGYVAIHLRYDTTWYVLTRRSLRIRRGIWTIHETTITFENVQNVSVSQGPLERMFGVANVLVETAGGGGGAAQAQGGQAMQTHRGLIEGIANAAEIRDMLMEQLRRSRTAGLGDETEAKPAARPKTAAWSPAHLAVLGEIRDAAARLAGVTSAASQRP